MLELSDEVTSEDNALKNLVYDLMLNFRKDAEEHYKAQQPPMEPYWDTEIMSINRFYERVCQFTSHQPMADPLLDVLVYFLKE